MFFDFKNLKTLKVGSLFVSVTPKPKIIEPVALPGERCGRTVPTEKGNGSQKARGHGRFGRLSAV